MNKPNCSQASLQSDILTSFTGGLQQDLQLFNFTSFSSYRGLQPLLAACSRTSNSSTSPASPATEVFNPSWQPAARHQTLQLHQLLQEDTILLLYLTRKRPRLIFQFQRYIFSKPRARENRNRGTNTSLLCCWARGMTEVLVDGSRRKETNS